MGTMIKRAVMGTVLWAVSMWVLITYAKGIPPLSDALFATLFAGVIAVQTFPPSKGEQ